MGQSQETEKYKIILINLAKRTDRLEFMTNQLKKLSLDFDRLEGVDGREYLACYNADGKLKSPAELSASSLDINTLPEICEYDESCAVKMTGHKMTPGGLGCTLSHRYCYQKFLTDPKYKNTEYLLILEDDVILPENFPAVLNELCNQNINSNNWNYLQFNYQLWRYDRDGNVLKYLVNNFKSQWKIFLEKKSIGDRMKRLLNLVSMPFLRVIINSWYLSLQDKNTYREFKFKIEPCLGCYVIDKKTAAQMLLLTEKICYTSDSVLNHWWRQSRRHRKELKCCFYAPAIDQLGDLGSDNL